MVGAGSGECSGVEQGEVVVSESGVSRVAEERGVVKERWSEAVEK